MTSINVKYFEACSVQALHRAPPNQKRVGMVEMSRRGGRCTSVSSTMMRAAGCGGGSSGGVRHGGGDQEAESGTAPSGSEDSGVEHSRGCWSDMAEQAVSGATRKKSRGWQPRDDAVEQAVSMTTGGRRGGDGRREGGHAAEEVRGVELLARWRWWCTSKFW
jgi:hypothetical protein